MAERGPARFYREAGVEERPGGVRLVLDGRPARTPGRAELLLPTAALGEAVAAEWDRQGETVVPASMPLTRLANSAIDGVARETGAVRDEIARYAGSDLLIYRADEPDALAEAQRASWDPVLDAIRDRLGARFALREGLIHLEQPADALAAIATRLARETSPFRLAALHVVTTLTGSALLAVALADGALTPDAAWDAAHVDEVFQESRWGTDEEALARRANRRVEFDAAAQVLSLA